MEVLVGPTFSIEASPCTSPSSQSQCERAGNCIFFKDEEQISGRIRLGLEEEDISSDSSSSIGAPDDSDDEEEEVDSGIGALSSLDSLEESLPNKRGLSNHFAGKSKSFSNLSEVTSNNCSSVKDLVKSENPFNKRRRILMANRWRKSSFYSWSNPKSMPLLSLAEDEPYDDDDHRSKQDDEEENQSSSSSTEQLDRLHQSLPKFSSKLKDRKFKASFKSQSCFNLTDLQEEDDYDDDDEQYL